MPRASGNNEPPYAVRAGQIWSHPAARGRRFVKVLRVHKLEPNAPYVDLRETNAAGETFTRRARDGFPGALVFQHNLTPDPVTRHWTMGLRYTLEKDK